MTPVRLTVGLCLGFIAVVVGLFVYSVTRTPVLSDAEMRELGVFILPRPREITAFELEDHHGRVFDLEALRDRWTFAFFGFTNCPDVCPTSMAVLGQARTLLEREGSEQLDRFQVLLVSVDPERDDAETLGRYATAFSEDFLGVRGEREAVADLAAQVNVSFAKVPMRDDEGNYLTDRYQVDHVANVVIINPKGHYHGFIKYPQQADTIAMTFESLAANF